MIPTINLVSSTGKAGKLSFPTEETRFLATGFLNNYFINPF
jgi:hypothetical protein